MIKVMISRDGYYSVIGDSKLKTLLFKIDKNDSKDLDLKQFEEKAMAKLEELGVEDYPYPRHAKCLKEIITQVFVTDEALAEKKKIETNMRKKALILQKQSTLPIIRSSTKKVQFDRGDYSLDRDSVRKSTIKNSKISSNIRRESN